jgi:hypothetical protein
VKVLAPLLLLFCIATTFAQQPTPEAKPDFSGTWVFNAHKSKLKMPAPENLTLRIEQKNAHVQLVRTQTYGGQKFDWTLDGAIDGKQEVVQKNPQYTANIRVYWQGDALILDQKITATDGTVATDIVTYSLESDGRTLLGMERQETVGSSGGATNKWVYERQAQ